ncbi:MAG TPA: class I SAM-dependent methyltransferase [Noviherbaspirillum sp.]
MRGNRVDASSPRTRSLLETPAIRALLFQLLALIVVASVAISLSIFADLDVPLLAAAGLQGLLAALLSRRYLASWWFGIQFLFPVGAVAFNAFHLPPAIYLCGFFVFVALYWSTFRTQVPFYPSNRMVWNEVANMLPADRPLRFIDIGSGFGGLVMHLAALRPDSAFMGIELAPLPWLASRIRASVLGSTGAFLRGDYNALDFSQFDVVFAYLSPAAMPALWRKARSEMRPGALLLSYEFPIPETEPQVILHCGRRGEALYIWKM